MRNNSELQSGTETETTIHTKDTQPPDIHATKIDSEIQNSRRNLLPKYHTAWNAWCQCLSGPNTGNGGSDVCLASHHTLANNNHHNNHITGLQGLFQNHCHFQRLLHRDVTQNALLEEPERIEDWWRGALTQGEEDVNAQQPHPNEPLRAQATAV
uniref:Uncharacterized protein n=1 Tax=Proboscia inermis TaxID=420281 RepID=A0A7S0C5G1_9STRA|mmetsp:Transcript_28087/g.28465  ORF Transcript_28087/g.28465 Transcript_28087/m.28465 type:complete len:155 (+) Transcript_28087:380-844(+)